MTTAQKFIKYFALGIAACVVVAIATGLTFGLYALGSVTGLVQSDDYVMENAEVISGETKTISQLVVQLDATSLEIKTGEEFKVETDRSDITFENKDGVATVKESGDYWRFFNHLKGKTVVYLPEDVQLENVLIKNGAGSTNIEKLVTKKLKLEVGAGAAKLSEVNVTEYADIDGGVGKIEILSGTINNLDLDLGVGSANVKAAITGNSEIDTGVGGLNVTLIGAREDYRIKVNKGLGGITVDGQDAHDGQEIGDGVNGIKISGGVGGIKVEFENK